jgi:VWFA-related protein
MRPLLLPLGLAALVAAAGGAGVARQDQPREHLTIDFVALDHSGAPITDLRKDEVEVWIGHFLVPTETFAAVTPDSPAPGGRLFLLVMDDVTLPPPYVPRAKEVAKHLVDRMSPDDRMAIVTLTGSEMKTTNDRAELMSAISTFSVRANGYNRADVLGAHLLKTLGDLARQSIEGANGRKTFIGIGTGAFLDKPIPPPLDGSILLPDWVDAMRMMALSNASFYVIDPSTGLHRIPDSGDIGLAHATGGRAFLSTNDINGAADKIVREAANYYLVGVNAPPVGRAADLRDLEIKVKRKGVTVHARQAVSGGR